MTRSTRAFAPATIANLAVGFDLMGLALAPLDGSTWGDVVVVRDAPGLATPFRVTAEGPHAGDLPSRPEANVVHAVAERFLAHGYDRRSARTPLEIVLEKHLPVSSGLGGSASSSVAALVALNRHLGEPLSKPELLPLAGEAEGFTSGARHYDNVTPSLLGGVCLLEGEGAARCVRLPWPEPWVLVLATPEFAIPTRAARAVLPVQVPLRTTLRYAQNLALFVAALYTRDAELARSCLDDVLVEPARGALLPGFHEAKAGALERGALGCSLSGSGPAVFAVAPAAEAAQPIAEALVRGLASAGLHATWRLARVDERGARVLEEIAG